MPALEPPSNLVNGQQEGHHGAPLSADRASVLNALPGTSESGEGAFTETGVKSATPLPQVLDGTSQVLSSKVDEKGEPLPIIWFDIDNTLYSRNTQIAELMGKRIHEYFVKIGLSHELAHDLHVKYYSMYGLALRGLVKHHHVDPLDYDKQCDGALPLEDILTPEPKIRKLLLDLDRKKVRVWALTNAYVNHARRVLRLLNVIDQFEGVVYADYAKKDFACKPEPEYFRQAMHESKCPDKNKHYFVDDSAINVKGAKDFGWKSAIHFQEIGDEPAASLDGIADARITDLDQLRTLPFWQDFFKKEGRS